MIGLRSPNFWWQQPRTLSARLLEPLGAAWGALAGARMEKSGTKLDLPVITIGAFALGGAGKTPTVEAIVRMLLERGEQPAILSRGYSGAAARSRTPRVVDLVHDTARDVGDEPLLLARVAPVIVGADRRASARLAQRAHRASVLVLDDGLQSRQIEPGFTVAVVDGAVGVGNSRCFPAGPLRAPFRAQLPRVDAVVVVGPGEPGHELAEIAAKTNKPVFTARLMPKPGEAARLAGRPVVAFAGIGRPQKFFATLAETGADVCATRAFPDHHAYSDRELAALQDEAQRQGASLITTEKDLVRLRSTQPPHPEELAKQASRRMAKATMVAASFETRSCGALLRMRASDIDALPVELVFDDPEGVAALLRSVLWR